MIVRFARGKRSDKPDTLTCLRDDGTSTWMVERPGFVFHDLAHYAVETTFRWRAGFFGLVASGWELRDFGHDPETGHKLRFPSPPPAVNVEYVVGLFQNERRGVTRPEDFYPALALVCAAPPAEVTAERIARVRGEIERLYGEWTAVPAGGSLELPFQL